MQADWKFLPILTLSLLVALGLDMLPAPSNFSAWQPPWVLLTLQYFVIQQKDGIGMTAAFALGLVLDVATSTPLGIHALAFAVVTASTQWAQRILATQTIIQQALWMAGATMIHQGVIVLMDNSSISETSAAMHFAPAITTLLAWPLINLTAWQVTHSTRRLRFHWK